MIEKFEIKIANLFEISARKIKKRIQKKKILDFCKKYGISDAKRTKKIDLRFNPYEGTNLYLIDELIKSNYISKDDVLIDVGCGAGLFLLYLLDAGYTNLQGLEFDETLYKILCSNLEIYKRRSKKTLEKFKLYNANAIEFDYDDKITVFYLFNTFYDKDTYLLWIKKVEVSFKRNPRNIKIIILYPTVASMGAMRETGWLMEKGRIICDAQTCYNCVHFIVYEGGASIENTVDFHN